MTTIQINKKIYYLIIERFENGVKSEFEVIGSSKEIMAFVKQFKDKELRFKVNELLNSEEIKIEHENKSKNQTYKIRKIEYKRVERIDPDRTNLKGENIEEKRKSIIQNTILQIENKKEISSIADQLIKHLYRSKDLKKEIKELEIKRIQSNSLYRAYTYCEVDLDYIDSNDFIVYHRNINYIGGIKILLQNSKIESIKIIYSGIGSFKMREFELRLMGKAVSDIDNEIINPKEKLEELKQFCNEVKTRYKE